MELSKAIPRSLPARLARTAAQQRHSNVAGLACSPMAIWSRRQFASDSKNSFPGPQGLGMGGSGGGQTSYFQKSQSLPANTIIRFVPQQTAWIVERMGKFHRILSPGLAIMIPVLDVRRAAPFYRTDVDSSTAHCLRPKPQRISYRNSQPECHHCR